MFGLNVSQYITGAQTASDANANGTQTHGASSYTYSEATDSAPTTQARFNMLFGFQPHMTWKFSDEIETMFAVGYYVWNDSSNTNRTGGGFDNSLAGTGFNSASSGNSTPAVNSALYRLSNPKQWQFYNTWTLPFNLMASLEYVMNKTTAYSFRTIANYPTNAAEVDANRDAWSATLKYGSVKKAHDWSVAATYGTKGIASVVNAYSYDKWLADNKGWMFSAAYAIADNFNLGWKGMWLGERARLATATTTTQTAGQPYAGMNSSQDMKTKYWELTAGVMF
jgi:hypothetical protein